MSPKIYGLQKLTNMYWWIYVVIDAQSSISGKYQATQTHTDKIHISNSAYIFQHTLLQISNTQKDKNSIINKRNTKITSITQPKSSRIVRPLIQTDEATDEASFPKVTQKTRNKSVKTSTSDKIHRRNLRNELQ